MPNPFSRWSLAAAIAVAGACGGSPRAVADVPAPVTNTPVTPMPAVSLSDVADAYVRLVLALGVHDPDYVDAYYGPAAVREEANAAKRPVPAVRAHALALLDTLQRVPTPITPMEQLRQDYLRRQLTALIARAEHVEGRRFPFDEESRAWFDAAAPVLPEAHFQQALAALDTALPGSGPVAARFEAWRRRFVIPRERLDTVFRTAIAACRTRTAAHVELPAGESFVVEYVTDKPWSGYNWYKGGYHSVIQVNTDLPIFIDRAVDLACHEGYPGHHAYNVLLEKHLVRDRGWNEFTVYPLFSPQSLIAEGSANYGIEIAFPGDSRVRFEADSLFPLAGLDPATAAEYYRVMALVDRLGYAGNEAARRYLNGEITADAAAEWLTRYALMEPARARQRVRFFDTYRSYVINYNLGEDLVRAYVEREAGADPARRWEVFEALISSPRLPSGLR